MGRELGDDLLEEGDKVPTGVACSGVSVNAASRGVQRLVEGERPMPLVFESVTLGAAGRKPEYRIS
jgi:hypothetical protein